MITRIVLTFIICQISLACLANDNLEWEIFKKRQLESPIYFNEKIENQADNQAQNNLELRTKHQESVSLFNYDVSTNNNLKDIKEKEITTTLKPFSLSDKMGRFTLGTSYYSSEHKAKDLQSNSYGLFTNYELGRFSLETEYERYTDRDFEDPNDNLYLTPSLELTRNLAIKIQHGKEIEAQNYKNDFILEYSLKNNPILKVENMKLELNASYINSYNKEQQKQIGAKAKYYF